jgi:uncharacterized protein YktA (UPF0223 family)
VVVICLI